MTELGLPKSVERDTQSTFSTTQSSVSTLHKIARRNHLQVSWSLLDESGPPHCPAFTVKLLLVEPNSKETEHFHGFGKRLRDAKHLAATQALERSSILTAILQKDEVRRQKPLRSREHQLLQNLTLNVPHPLGPRAEILQLARLLKVEANFCRLPGPPHPRIGDGLRFSTQSIYRVALCFGGRQYVGEASTLSGAEQEASVAVLKALRLVLSSLETFSKTERYPPQPDQRIHFRPNCSIWRLQVLAGLHRVHPSFKVFLSDFSTADEPTRNARKTYRCICSLPSFESVEAIGPSRAIARKLAAEVMLSRLIPEPSNNVVTPVQNTRSSTAIRNERCKSTKTKTGQNFKLGRASPGYGAHVHPMARLQYIASAKGIPGPRCSVSIDEPLVSNGSPRLEGCISRPPSQFRCKMQFDNHSTVGPPAPCKRLAKRFAAEAMLELLGFHRPKSPTPISVLRPSPTERNASCKSQDDSDHSSPNELKSCSDADHTRHIAFSSTMDVLVLDDSAANASRRPFKIRSNRITCSQKMTPSSELHSDHRTPQRTSSASSLLLHSVCSDNEFTTSPIGHWSESAEALGSGYSPLFRQVRSRSTSNASDGGSHDRRPSVYDFTLFSASLPRCHSSSSLPSQAVSPKRTPINSKMRLLSRLAVFFLNENSKKCSTSGNLQTNTYPDATKQLLSLCQRLQIPCKFIDRPPSQGLLGETAGISGISEALQHSTLLVIGESALAASGENEPTASQNTVVVRALGLNMLSAREQASLAAFRHLSEL